jgi:ABC-type multidrug transport system ATPase subunit
MLPMDFCDIYPFNERAGKALELLERVGLGELAHKLPGAVSSGQQQSAAIARAMATDPSIILADEPTGNLDSRSAEIVLKLFEQLASEGKTILIVTHDPSITSRTDQTIILSDGEIVDEAVATSLPLLTHPQMLAATKKAKRKTFSPNELILKQGQQVDSFYMVNSGFVEVLISNSNGDEMSLARLGPGQYFGEVELTQNNESIASVRAAADQEAVIAELPKKEFIRILKESKDMQSSIRKTALDRMTENKSRSEVKS